MHVRKQWNRWSLWLFKLFNKLIKIDYVDYGQLVLYDRIAIDWKLPKLVMNWTPYEKEEKKKTDENKVGGNKKAMNDRNHECGNNRVAVRNEGLLSCTDVA